MPSSRTSSSVSIRSSQRVRGDDLPGNRSGRSRGCGCSGARRAPASSSPCARVRMPSEQAMLISTSAWMAATASRTCAIRRSSGPRTAATRQNSVAPVAAVCRAASTSAGMSSRTARTGRLEAARLRAEVAVLGAAAGLDRDDPLDLDGRAAPSHPHLMSQLQRLRHPLVGQAPARPASAAHRARPRARAPARGRRPGCRSLIARAKPCPAVSRR